ncbi:MAG: hypothetical protein QMD50_01090 [Patescibacteria group bacterium]|nr:hypothetical protein [Patescibacteria group bacterium]
MLFVLIAKLREAGAIVVDVGFEMFVPFSNGDRPLPEEIRLLRREADFKEVFGLSIQELTISRSQEGVK